MTIELYAQRYDTIRKLVLKISKEELVFDAIEAVAIKVFGADREKPPTPEEFDELIDKLNVLVTT